MSKINQSFKLVRGEDQILEFTSDVEISISGWTILFEANLSTKAVSASPDITKSTSSGITIINSSEGIINVAINSADTTDLDLGVYNWELWRDDSGYKRQLASGKFDLLRTIRNF